MNELQFLGADGLMPKPRVFLPLKEAKKIWTWTISVPGEINGLGLIERRQNDFWVTEALLLKEKVSWGRATIDPLAFNRYVGECEDPSKIRLQWHSHGDISARFFSSKDTHDTIAKWTGEYLISLVVNKQGEYCCRLDIFKPVYLGFEIPLLIVMPVEKEILDFCWQEIEEKVRPHDRDFLQKIKRLLLGQKIGEPDWDQEKNPLALPWQNFQFAAAEPSEKNEEEQENG